MHIQIKALHVNKILSTLILTAFFLANFYLFFEYIRPGSGANSDFLTHRRFAFEFGESTSLSYSIYHMFVKFVAQAMTMFRQREVFYYSLSMVFVMVGSQAYTFYILNNYFKKLYTNRSSLLRHALIAGLLVLSMFFDVDDRHLYLGTGTPNPWHNPTYMFARPFCILLFLHTVEMFKKRILDRKDYIVLGSLALVSMAAKPSFLISFLPAIACFGLYGWVKKEMTFMQMLKIGLSLLVSFIPFIVIYKLAFGGGEGNGSVVFTNGKIWKVWSDNIGLSILKAIVFPLFIVLVNIKRLSKSLKFAVLNYIFSGLIFYYLAESGEREMHGNFIWTYLFGLFFLFLFAIEQLFFNEEKRKYVWILGVLLLITHIGFGIYYLNNQLNGLGYY